MPPDLPSLRTQTTVVCGALALVIAISMLLRGRVRLVHFLFAAFAADIGLWYLFQFLFGVWTRLNAILALLLPPFALRLFEAMVPYEQRRRPRSLRILELLAVPIALLVLFFLNSPLDSWLRRAVFLYVFATLTVGLYELGRRGVESGSLATQRRVQVLVVIGALAGMASVVDLVSVLIPQLPPVGAPPSVVFLFVLAQALRHERLLDIYEIFARLLVATAVAFLIAGIFYVLSTYTGGFGNIYLNAVLAAIVILVLFEPLRGRVEEQIERLFFRERFDLEQSIAEARRRLVHVLEVGEMGDIVMAALEQSHRVTAAALYLRDEDGSGFERLAARGMKIPQRIEFASARALIDRIEKGPVAMEQVELEVRECRARGARPDAAEAVLAAAAVLGSLCHGVVMGVHAEGGELTGLLVVADDRVRDAFSTEEITLLHSLAVPIGVVIQNSHVYAQMKERDRLAVLGQMAAGLAHEIRNPLGAIKGAAQLLADPDPNAREPDSTTREFLGIILEEVDRLDRVVGSVLDLARANQGAVVPTDVNATIRRTLQILSTERTSDDLKLDVMLDPALPRAAIDPEQLRQVIMNLFRNAAQAMKGRGRIGISTRIRFGRGTRPGAGGPDETLVEITVTDNGPGISQKVLQNIFLPFFTTKETGTGLGLAISQRIVQGAGGRIEVRSYEGKGSSFTVILPAALEALVTPTPPLKVEELKVEG